jgi:hypothetical protein
MTGRDNDPLIGAIRKPPLKFEDQILGVLENTQQRSLLHIDLQLVD